MQVLVKFVLYLDVCEQVMEAQKPGSIGHRPPTLDILRSLNVVQTGQSLCTSHMFTERS